MSWIVALLVVVLTAVAGALLTGDPASAPYATLQKPSWTPPLYVWLLVGAAYYAGVTVALARLLEHRGQRYVVGALILVLAVLLTNELWNIFLFRLGRADLAFYFLVPFALLVAAAGAATWRVDRPAGTILFVYLGWLTFDFAWTHRLAQLN